MAKFYQWNTQQDFNAWHEAIMAEKNIPNEFTFAYTLSVQVDDKVIATVENEDAEGLTPTSLRPPKIDDFLGA
jgi:hypothetical protein